MKKRTLTGLVAMLVLTGSLSSCENKVSTSAYLPLGDQSILKVSMTVSGGKTKAISYDATFTANYWAKLDMDKINADGIKVNTVEVTLYGETSYYAKDLKLGGYIYHGVRNGDNDLVNMEYVDYMAENTSKAPSGETTLTAFIFQGDADVNIGSYAGWYFDCIKNGYGTKGRIDKSNFYDYGFEALDEDGNLLDKKYLNLSSTLFKADDDYNGADKAAFDSYEDIMNKAFIDQVFYPLSGQNNKVKVVKNNDEKCWEMYSVDADDNETLLKKLTDVPSSFSGFRDYYRVSQMAFAALEYKSYGWL